MSGEDATTPKGDAAVRAVIGRLDALLDRERSALLTGDLDAMSDILERKENLIESLVSLTAGEEPSIGALEDKAARNQALMDGALKGIRRAAARMAAFRRIRRSLETYDRAGRKTEIRDGAAHSVERRA